MRKSLILLFSVHLDFSLNLLLSLTSSFFLPRHKLFGGEAPASREDALDSLLAMGLCDEDGRRVGAEANGGNGAAADGEEMEDDAEEEARSAPKKRAAAGARGGVKA
jgi:hypothetical protein